MCERIYIIRTSRQEEVPIHSLVRKSCHSKGGYTGKSQTHYFSGLWNLPEVRYFFKYFKAVTPPSGKKITWNICVITLVIQQRSVPALQRLSEDWRLVEEDMHDILSLFFPNLSLSKNDVCRFLTSRSRRILTRKGGSHEKQPHVLHHKNGYLRTTFSQLADQLFQNLHPACITSDS